MRYRPGIRLLLIFLFSTMSGLTQPGFCHDAPAGVGDEAAAEQDETSKKKPAADEKDEADDSKATKEDDKQEDAQSEADAADDDGEDSDSDDSSDEIKLKCYFVATEASQIVIRPSEWSSFPIVDVVEHGTEVSKGDTLIEIDARKLDAAIQDLEYEIAESTLSLAEQEEARRVAERTDQLAMEAAERAEQRAAEDLKRFLTRERGDRLQSLDRSVKSAENRLAYAQEEYNQLKRMYEADDLTEDTEEIILRRTRDSVESSEYSLDRYRRSRDRGIDVDLPRSEVELENAVRRATLALEQARIKLPNNAKRLEMALEKKRVALKRKQERLERLKQDRELLEIRSPISGHVYYGSQRNGRWSDVGQVGATLRSGVSAKTNQTLMTVVRNGSLELTGTVSEANLKALSVGQTGTAEPTADKQVEFPVTISEIAAIPISEGKFVVRLAMDGDLPEEFKATAGMTCTVMFTTQGSTDG